MAFTDASSYFPDVSTRPLLHSSSKLRRYSAARFAEGTRRITFSSRVHESLVQLVEPVQTAAVSSPASRTTYLWCISEGTPGTGRLGTPRAAMKAVSGLGGFQLSGVELLDHVAGLLDVVCDHHQVHVVGRDLALREHPAPDPLEQSAPVVGAEEDHREMDDAPRLDQSERFEELIESPESPWKDHESLRVLDEHRLADEEVMKLDAEIDVLVEALFEWKLDIAAHGEAVPLARPPVGGLHDAGSAPGDDGETGAGELGGQLARGAVHGIGFAHSCGAEKRHRRADRRQRIKALDELGLDAEHPPWVGLEEFRCGRAPFEQLAVLGLSLQAAPHHTTGAPPVSLLRHPTLLRGLLYRPARRRSDCPRGHGPANQASAGVPIPTARASPRAAPAR